MLHYYLKRRKYTESKSPKVAKTTKGKLMLLSKFAVWNSEKNTSIKDKEACGLLSNLGLKTPLDKIQY